MSKYRKFKRHQCPKCTEYFWYNDKPRCGYHTYDIADSAYLKGTTGAKCKHFEEAQDD